MGRKGHRTTHTGNVRTIKERRVRHDGEEGVACLTGALHNHPSKQGERGAGQDGRRMVKAKAKTEKRTILLSVEVGGGARL